MRTDVLLGLTVGGVLAFGMVAALLSDPPKANQDPRTSTLITGPDGSQALYETLAELGIPVQRRRTALFNLSEQEHVVGALAVLAPLHGLLTEELSEVVAYVRAGGAVIAAGWGGGITGCVGYETARADSGTLDLGDAAPIELGKEVAVRAPVAAPRLPPVRRVLRPWEIVERFERPEMRERSDAGCGLLVARSRDTLLATIDGRAVVLSLRYEGGGRVLLAADPVYFRNRAWRETDAAHFMIPLLVPGSGRRGPLVWDEYHQGFASGSSATGVLWQWLWQSPAGWAILQLGAVALVWLAVTAVRFGPALAVIERRRRSPLEHVEALAAGLEGANGADTAVELIISGLRRRLSRTGQIGTGDVATWLAALELALPSARGRAAARALLRLRKEPGGAERVLAAAQAVEDVWQDLRPASSPARS